MAKKLDCVFQHEEIPVYLRCIYWILRLIPSRIGEVLGMKIDCLKPYDKHYCLFIPTWKQNGGHFEPIMRVIHIEDVGISSILIALVKQQQEERNRYRDGFLTFDLVTFSNIRAIIR